MSTPARRPRSSTSARTGLPSLSGSKRLKSGARTTGASQANTAASTATAALPGIHQRFGKRRTSAISSPPPPAANAAPIAADLDASPSHEPRPWVEMP